MTSPKSAGGWVSSEAVSRGVGWEGSGWELVLSRDTLWSRQTMSSLLKQGEVRGMNASVSLYSCPPITTVYPPPSLLLSGAPFSIPATPTFCLPPYFSLPFSFPSILLPSILPFLCQNPPGIETSLNKTQLPPQGT